MTPAEHSALDALLAWVAVLSDKDANGTGISGAQVDTLKAGRALAVEREQAAEIVRFRNVPGVGEAKEKA